MISTTTKPKSKVELIRAIQHLYNPKIEVIEVMSDQTFKQVSTKVDALRKRGNVSVVIIQDL